MRIEDHHRTSPTAQTDLIGMIRQAIRERFAGQFATTMRPRNNSRAAVFCGIIIDQPGRIADKIVPGLYRFAPVGMQLLLALDFENLLNLR